MKRSTIITSASVLAMATVPAVAAAHGTGQRHGDELRVKHTRGTVASFADGVLTIAKADGTTVVAKVTSRTRIRCKVAGPVASSARHGDDDATGDDRHGRGRDDARGHGRGGDDDSAGSTGTGTVVRNRRCTTADLTAGTVVRRADWRGTAGTAVWRTIQLVK